MDINQKQKERLEQQFAFIREIDKEKFIGRQTYLTDGERKENDAEHAWHMAIMTVLLAEYSNEPIDVLKTVTMLLIHDLVEIDAGDTYAYDEEAKKTQRERELKGAERIFGMLPPDQGENCALSGMNLKPGRRRKHGLHIRWTTSSRRCSMMLPRERRGRRVACT